MGGESVNTASSMGKMLITMLAGFAEFERNLIAERTTAALCHKKAHGEVYNHVPFGYRAVDGSLVPDPAEQTVIARMATLRALGLSYHRLVDTLNADGVPTKQGGEWHAQTVKNILEAAA
jgi:DNA invertase Pin-like site-specific DNA recombinase